MGSALRHFAHKYLNTSVGRGPKYSKITLLKVTGDLWLGSGGHGTSSRATVIITYFVNNLHDGSNWGISC
jgi:hypothetical protein